MNSTRLLLIFVFLYQVACNENDKPDFPGSEVSQASGDLQLKQSRSAVSAFELDDSEFRPNGLRVGKQDFLNYECPVISYFMPKKADYVEILRCQSDAIIRGTFDNLSDVDLGNESIDIETTTFQTNKFWEAAASQRTCSLIATDYTDNNQFMDCATASGSYRYILRACVDTERLRDTELLQDSRNCSRQVALSQPLKDYVNRRSRDAREAIAEMTLNRTRADNLGRQIYGKVLEYNNALIACQDLSMERETYRRKAEAINKILGFGISLGAQLLFPEEIGTSRINSFKDVWENGNDIGSRGAQIAGFLSLLTASEGTVDRPEGNFGCPAAYKREKEIGILKRELQSIHQTFSIEYERAKRFGSDFEEQGPNGLEEIP